MMKPKVLTLFGQGINCDDETARAFSIAGADPEKVLMSELIDEKKNMQDYDILALPGGFSYGDDIAAGKIMAVEFRYRLRDQMQQFVEKKRPIVGICNGFQIMTTLGLLPGLDGEYAVQSVTLGANDSGKFRDGWVYLEIDPQSKCIATKGIDRLELPIRHGEGRLYTGPEVLRKMKEGGQVACRYVGPDGKEKPGYPWNPNGSLDDIAGICDPTGLVFGLMPHPEAAVEVHHYPRWTRDRTKAEENAERAMHVFRNIVDYVRG